MGKIKKNKFMENVIKGSISTIIILFTLLFLNSCDGVDNILSSPPVKGHEYSPPGVNSIPHLFPELSDSI